MVISHPLHPAALRLPFPLLPAPSTRLTVQLVISPFAAPAATVRVATYWVYSDPVRCEVATSLTANVYPAPDPLHDTVGVDTASLAVM